MRARAHELRLVDEAGHHEDRVRREVHGVVVELVVVGERALHRELGHRVDQVVEEERHEEGEALDEELPHAAQRCRHAALSLKERERHGEQDERCHGAHGHAKTRHREIARHEQHQRERHEPQHAARRLREAREVELGHEPQHAARRLREAREVELVLLLEAPLVDVGQAVHRAEDQNAHADGEHVRVIAAELAPHPAHQEHDRTGDKTVDLVVQEGAHVVQVRDLIGAHAVVGEEQEQRAHREGHREQARLLGAHEPGCDHREQREEHAPRRLARRVAEVVALGLVGEVLLGLLGELAAKDRGDQPVPPVVDDAGEKPGLPAARLRAVPAAPLARRHAVARRARGLWRC